MSNQQMLNLDEYEGWREDYVIDLSPSMPERDLNPPEYQEKVVDDPDSARDNFINIEPGHFGCNQIFRSKIEQKQMMDSFYKMYKKNSIEHHCKLLARGKKHV